MASSIKRLLVGAPIASSEEHHQRLGKPTALAVFASDAISSTAYATEEILLVLVPVAGMVAIDYLVPIAIVVVVLLAIVATSYRQTIHAYPGGGGSYVVSRENLGTVPSLVAAASLLVDYVLTVAVSVSAGVAAIDSAFPELYPYRVWLCLAAVAIMTVANLRGVKESGRLFAGPTYIYVVSLLALIGIGLARSFLGDLGPMPVNEEALREVMGDSFLSPQTVSLFILLRAFSSGAVALSGVEAISNGVPAFRRPESRNASATLVMMATILGTTFFGVSLLAERIRPTVSENETLLSTMGAYVFGGENIPYYILQFATFAILILAANTAYADFPRLSSIVARDGFLPRQLANRGDRLVYSNGIIGLAVVAGALIVAFGGEVVALIPLYAVGVFTGFTLSQTGMVVHHWKLREPKWQRGLVINAVGAVATFVVLLVVVVSKFTIGAWIPAVLIPLIVFVLLRIHRHYKRVTAFLAVTPGWRPRRRTHQVVVLVGRVNKGVMEALWYARSLAPDRLVAVTVVYDHEEEEAAHKAWTEYDIPIELHTLYSPYRDLTEPVVAFLDELDADYPDDMITVVIPEFVVAHWYEQALHNQSAFFLKSRLHYRPDTVVTSVPIHLDQSAGEPDRSLSDRGGRAPDRARPPRP